MEKATQPARYTVGKWHDLPVYQCTACPFDSLKREEAERHYEDRHVPKTQTKPVQVPVYDRFGNLITEREV